MELLQLAYFCDTAEYENISRTAEKHRVPPSGVSQSIKRLERELGVELFSRTANRVSLNESGKIFYKAAKCALESLAEARDILEERDGEPRGEIRLLIQTNRRTVTLAIEKFKKLYPAVSFVIDHTGAVNGQTYDLVVSDVSPGRDFIGEELMVEKVMLAVNKSSHLATLKRVDVAALRNERFVTMSKNSRFFDFSDKICQEAGFVPNTVISTDDPYYVRKYVEMGLGIAFVPSVSWRGLFSENIMLLDIGGYERSTKLFLRADRAPTRRAVLFSEILKETFADEAKGD